MSYDFADTPHDGRVIAELTREIAFKQARIQELEGALRSSKGYLLNARIDLSTGCTKATAIRTINGGLSMINAALEAKPAEAAK